MSIGLMVIATCLLMATGVPVSWAQSEPITPEAIEKAIEALGAAGFRERRAAKSFLWNAGPLAEAALEK
ncbi:MAG: hypothetical protein AAF492_04580, partial [Verrucomicrobiota bacterium]